MHPRNARLAAVLVALCSATALHAEKPLIAVLPFQAVEVAASTAQIIATLFETNLVNTSAYTVLSQNERQQILSAQEQSLSDCTDEACAVEIGKLLAAEQIIMGTVAALGKKLIINAKIIDVQTSKTLAAGNISANSIEELDIACETLTTTLVAKINPTAVAAAPATTAQPAATPAATPTEAPKTTTPATTAPATAAPTTAPAATTTEPTPAKTTPEKETPPAKVPRTRPQPTVGGIDVVGLVLVSGGAALGGAARLVQSTGETLRSRAQDAWATYRNATVNLGDLYAAYEDAFGAYRSASIAAYALWGAAPAATAAGLLVTPTTALSLSPGGKVAYAAGTLIGTAAGALQGVSAGKASTMREAWRLYLSADSDLDPLYRAYEDAYASYRTTSILSYGAAGVGVLAIPAAFLLPGERSAVGSSFVAKALMTGGSLLTSAGSYLFGSACGARARADGAWAEYMTATTSLDDLYAQYEEAFAGYRVRSLAAYGTWVAGAVATCVGVFLPAPAATAGISARSMLPANVSLTASPSVDGMTVALRATW